MGKESAREHSRPGGGGASVRTVDEWTLIRFLRLLAVGFFVWAATRLARGLAGDGRS
jgi:hypothetical protein